MKFFIFSEHVHYRSIDRYDLSRYIDDVHKSCLEEKNFFSGVHWSNRNQGLQEISATSGVNIRKNRKNRLCYRSIDRSGSSRVNKYKKFTFKYRVLFFIFKFSNYNAFHLFSVFYFFV